MARSLNASVTVVAVQVVPYPVPLDEPPVPFEFVVRHFEEMIKKPGEPTPLSAYVCRDQVEALKRILPPASPVLISVRKKLWPTREQKLARKLRHAGFDVISVHQE